MDYDFLTALRRQHPGWRLLAVDHGPMIAAFLHHYFIAPNQRAFAETELSSRLEDFLFQLRPRLGEGAFPKSPRQYLNDWSADERGWLRKYYPRDTDEPHYDLAPATEKALQWLASLQAQRFIGAESRLLTVFKLLREITEGTETDPQVRIDELTRRKAEIEREIEEINAGRLRIMDDTRLRERFLQMSDTARALLADFRQVEQNFRDLDRQVREKLASWDGSKGDLLAEVFGEQDAITDTDQGRTFRAFWDFLMSASRQEELSDLIHKVLALDPVRELEPDPRLQRVHYDWLEAGESTLRTVARLSEQLRRYLDDQAWLENSRIMQLLHDVEQHALSVRGSTPQNLNMSIDALAPSVMLPLERPLYQPPLKPYIAESELTTGDAELDTSVLFDQFFVDRVALQSRLHRVLQSRDQVTLSTLLEHSPLERGLAELVAWLALAADDPKALIDDTDESEVSWQDDHGMLRRATVPKVLFSR